MKLHLPSALRRALLLALLAVPTLCPVAESAALHSDVTMATYTDFGQNKGRYVVANRNALLQHLADTGGVQINYTSGQDAYTLPHGMVDFTGIAANGASTAIGYNYVATVRHNGVQAPTFSGNDLAAGQSICYYGIEYRYASDFRLTPNADYKITRLSKLVTDVAGAAIYSGNTGSALVGQTIYRAGAGRMFRENEQGELEKVASEHTYITGGIDRIESLNGDFPIASDGSHSFCSNFKWESDSPDSAGPLPFYVQDGDSGSPVYIWNSENGRYEYLGVEQAKSPQDVQGNSFATTATGWTQQTMDSDTFNCRVTLGSDNLLRLSDFVSEAYTYAGNNNGTAVSGTTYTRWLYNGTSSSPIAYLSGNKQGVNTWSDLGTLKDTDNWYAYDNSYLNASVNGSVDDFTYGDLYYTQNLVVTASSTAQQTVQVEADTDLGLGYVQFCRADGVDSANFLVTSISGQSYVLNSAGYVVDEGVTVHLQLTNPADYVREWRKVGEGTLSIEGSGNNEVLLNLGGSGRTLLKRSGGYAAYNVLANNGTTVVIDDIGQIARDFTFGYQGAVLDMNGNSMTWNNDNQASGEGFTIHALDEGAVISNSAAQKTTLTWTQGGAQTWLGSFADSATGALEFVYNGGAGSRLAMHSIRTDLTQHADSGMTVQSGSVVLMGTHTVHGVGSMTGTDKQRYSHEDDWHYADAAMDVTVKSGASFELGSHARLSGDVVVETGGTYIMREGVTHRYEYIEGGYDLEDTDNIRAFFGHHGNVELGGGATMKVEFNEGADSTLVYGGNITGAGNVSIDLGTQGSMLKLTGTGSTFSGSKTITSGGVYAASLGDTSTRKWVIGAQGWLASDALATAADVKAAVDSSSTGVLALTRDMAEDLTAVGYSSLIVGAAPDKEVHYGTADAELTAVNGKWTLGGGGGNLIVDFKLAGDSQLVLGNEYGKGNVHLSNAKNTFTGGIAFAGGVTLTYGEGALGGSTLALSYGNRAMLTPSDIGKLDEGAKGTLLVDRIANLSVDMRPQPGLFLGAAADVTYSGAITLADGESYRFGGSTGRLTFSSALESGRNMVIDGQGWTGGSVVLTNAGMLDGSVTVKGYDSALTTGTVGDATLAFAADNAMANVSSYSVQGGGIIDLSGTRQTLNGLTVGSGGLVSDSSATGSATLTLGSGSVTDGGVIDVAHIVKAGSGTFKLDEGSSTHFATFEITGGTVVVFTDYSKAAFDASGRVIVSDGGVLDMWNRVSAAAVELRNGGSIARASGFHDLIVASGAEASLASNGNVGLSGTLTLEENAHLAASVASLTLETIAGNGSADFSASSTSASALQIKGNNQAFTGRLGIACNAFSGNTGVIFSSASSYGSGTIALDRVLMTMTTANTAATAVKATLELGSGGVIFNATAGNSYYFGALAGSGALKTTAASGATWFRGDVRGFSGTLDRNDTAASTFTYGFGGAGLSYREVTGSTASGPIRLFADSDGTKLASSGSATLNYNFQYADDVVLNAMVSGAANVTHASTGTLVLSENNTATGTLTISAGGKLQFGEGGDSGSWAGQLSGTGTLVNRNTSAAGVTLASSSFTGSLDLMQGTKLSLPSLTTYALNAGLSLTVSAGGSQASAELNSRYLMLGGGTLAFSGEALGAEAALTLTNGVVAKNASVTTQAIALFDTEQLSAGTYKLVSGNWSSLSTNTSFSVTGVADYFTTSVSASNDGLYLTLAAAEGTMVWGGTDTSNTWSSAVFGTGAGSSAGQDVYFTDAAQSKSVSVSGTVAADSLVFNAREDYALAVEAGSSLTAGSLELMSSGKVRLESGVSVTGETTLAAGSELEVKSFATLGGTVSGAGTLTIDAGAGEGSESLSGLDTLRLVSGRYNVTSGVAGSGDAANIKVEGGQLYIWSSGTYTSNINLAGEGWQGDSDASSAAAFRSGGTSVNLSGVVTLDDDAAMALSHNSTVCLKSRLVGNEHTLTVKGLSGTTLCLDTSSGFSAENVSISVESGTLRFGGISSKGLLDGVTALSAAKNATISFLGSSSELNSAFTLEGGSTLELTATNNNDGVSYTFQGNMQLDKAADGTVQTNITSSAGRHLVLNGLISGDGGFVVKGSHSSALTLALNHSGNNFSGGVSVAAERSNVSITLASATAAGTGAISLGNESALLMVEGNAEAGNSEARYDTLANSISGAGKVNITAGRVALTGENTYAGGTAVAVDAALKVAHARAAGSGAVELASPTSKLVYAGAETGSYDQLANDVSGAGSVTVESGRVDFSTAKSYTGDTTVEQGATLRVSAAQDSSAQYAMKRGGKLEVAAAGAVSVGGAVAFAAASPADAVLENVTATSSSLSVTEALAPASVQGARVEVSAAQYAIADLEMRDSVVVAAVAEAIIEMHNVSMSGNSAVQGLSATATRIVAEGLTLNLAQVTPRTTASGSGGTAHVYDLAGVFKSLDLDGSMTLDFEASRARMLAPVGAAGAEQPDFIVVDFADSVDVSGLDLSLVLNGSTIAGQHLEGGQVLFSLSGEAWDGGVVPEPASSALALLGLAGLAGRRRRR